MNKRIEMVGRIWGTIIVLGLTVSITALVLNTLHKWDIVQKIIDVVFPFSILALALTVLVILLLTIWFSDQKEKP